MDDSSDASSPASRPSSSCHRYPNWVMLDPHTRLNYPRPSLDYPEEHFRATHAYGETSKGDPVRVSFRAVPPPGTSRIYVRWTPCTKGSSSSSSSRKGGEEDRWDRFYGEEPMILAAQGNSILLQLTTVDTNYSDFFVYMIHSNGKPPSLQRLPICDHELTTGIHFGGIEPDGIGLLCNAVTQDFVVAELIVLPKYDGSTTIHLEDCPVEAGLCIFRSSLPEDGWNATRPRIRHENGQGRELIWWDTDVVVPFGDYLCYVDYFRGVLFVDVLSECPELRYVRLPVTIPAGDPTDHGIRECPEQTRSVCVTNGGGTMKFVEVVTTTVFVAFSREPTSSFTINMWKLRQDNMTWEKESVMEDTELWSLRGYSDLPCAAPKFPLVSMEEPEVVCFVLRNNRPCGFPFEDSKDQIWVIVVDMLNKTLRSSSRYTSVRRNCFESDGNMASASLTTNLPFVACEFSNYLAHVSEQNRTRA